MNESPWQPPSDDRPDPATATPNAEPALPPTAATPPSPPPSPWSPEGAATWAEPAPGDTGDVPPAPTSPVPPPPGFETLASPATADEPVVQRRGRSKLVVAGVVAAVLALGLAGLFAVQRFSGEEAGGAASADELGLTLMAALEAEDVLGVIDTMLPGERESLGEPFVELVGELQRLEILSADTDLSKLLGLDLELSDEVVQVAGTNVPDIVNVTLEADASITLDGATLPLGAFVEEQLPDDALTELRGTRLTESDQLALELTAVQHDGRWYFSLFHTLAELARQEAGGEPIPDVGVTPEGGDSPEAAVDRLLDSVEQLDLGGVIAVLDPAEVAALQRYAPLFLDDADAALDEVPLEWQVDVREFRVEGDGGRRTVFVDALGISGVGDGVPFRVEFDGSCVRGELEGEAFEECGSATDEELESMLAESPAIEAFVTAVEDAFADLEPVGLELRERDGAWFVSPLATGSDGLLSVVRALDRAELDTLVETGGAALDEFFDLAFGGLGLIEDEFGFEDDFGFDDEPVLEPDVTVPGEPSSAAWEECLDERAAADATACFQRYLDAGDIDEFFVPTVLLHPECGLAELSWEGTIYSAPDDEFAAALEVAVPCFQALVDAGEIEEWMVPFEVEHADCFEGRNWYTEFEDDAYNERVDACLYGD